MTDQPNTRCNGRTAKGTRCTKRALSGSDRCAHHSFAIPGRPSRLTKDVADTITEALLEGNYLEVAAALAGVSKSSVYRWLRRADDLEAGALEHIDPDVDGEDVYNHVSPDDWVYLDFRHATKAAEAWAERELLGVVRQGQTGWQAYMTILERRHPERWGRRTALDHTVTGGLEQRTRVELVAPAEADRRAAVARVLEAAGALANPDQEEPPE